MVTNMRRSSAEAISIPLLAQHLPVPPPAELDPLLDAASECLARHGLSKTSVSDIAREMGVAPSTVYRKVGTVENAVLMVVAREGHRLLQRLPEVIAGVEGPRVITVFLAAAVQHIRSYPMVDKILHDEVEWMGRMATRRLEFSLEQAALGGLPMLVAAMDAGEIRRHDPYLLAHWIARILAMCISAPPPGDLQDALDMLLLPLLDPEH